MNMVLEHGAADSLGTMVTSCKGRSAVVNVGFSLELKMTVVM